MGNKVSIKEEFAKFSETNSPDELKKGLSSLTAMKIDDDNFRLSIFPNDIRKFIDAKPDLFKVAVEQVQSQIIHPPNSNPHLFASPFSVSTTCFQQLLGINP